MLYLVPTPIWNTEDITLRAVRLFRELKYFICEDTRTTKKLFQLLDIKYKWEKTRSNEEDVKIEIETAKEFFSLTSFTQEGKGYAAKWFFSACQLRKLAPHFPVPSHFPVYLQYSPSPTFQFNYKTYNHFQIPS